MGLYTEKNKKLNVSFILQVFARIFFLSKM